MKKSWDVYFDNDGLLSCYFGDGVYDSGDTAQKTGLFRFGRFFKFRKDKAQLEREAAKFNQELDMLESPNKKGYYVRHPEPTQWWSRTDLFTRDQQRSLVMAMGALKQRKRLYRIAWEHFKRLGWYQNNRYIDSNKGDLPEFLVRLFPKLKGWKFPDFAAPNHINEYIRAFWMAGCYWAALLYPIVIVFDLAETANFLFNYPKWKKDPDHSDEDNTIMSLLQAKVSLPTPISWLNRKLYKKHMPIMGFTDETKTVPLRLNPPAELVNGPVSAIAWKHRQLSAPPFSQLYTPILKEEL